MRDQPSDGPTVLLVGVDGSETSLRAGAYAAGLARRQGSRLVIVYVRTFRAAAGISAAAGAPLVEAQDEVARELRESIETFRGRSGVSVELVERVGNPFTEIVQLAKEIQADAVIVGASAQAGHRFIGSLAVHLVRAGRWPVTVVP